MSRYDLSDNELWEAIARDDSRAFAVFYDRHWRNIYRTVCYYLKDRNVAEQILHDIFVVLWKRRAHLRMENFQRYFHVTARYHVFILLRLGRCEA